MHFCYFLIVEAPPRLGAENPENLVSDALTVSVIVEDRWRCAQKKHHREKIHVL